MRRRSAALMGPIIAGLLSVACGRAVAPKIMAGMKFDPDPALFVGNESVHERLNDGSFAGFQAGDLYSSNPKESASFQVDGVGPDGTSKCSATLALHPAKTAGRLKKRNLDDNGNGIIIARVDNTSTGSGCRPTGFYRSVGLSGSVAFVARPGTMSGRDYEVILAPFPAGGDTVLMNLTFCGHHPRTDSDSAAHFTYQSNQKPCQVAHVPLAPGDDGPEREAPSPPAPTDDALEFAWLGCSNDCCAASQPPGNKGGK